MPQLMVEGGRVSSLGRTRSSSHEVFFPPHPEDKAFHRWKQESGEIKNNSLSQDSNKVLTCSHLVGSGHQLKAQDPSLC